MPNAKLSRHPIEKCRSRKVRRLTNGSVFRSVRTTNPGAVIAKRQRRVTVSGEDQPRFGASLMAISNPASATAPKLNASKSRLRSWSRDTRPRGNDRETTEAANTPGKTLIRKSHGQELVSVIHPPTTGPTVGARTARTPAIVAASGCNWTGKSRKTAEKTIGINVPPEKP